ncbi:Flp pilus assembly protein CpaB [Acidiphilium angustum]|uniref:Pilus assembly protein CpaB n=2 Tax=Acidiphilium rubrum TaxID=526 RepID=A0A8G2CN88_ACIRU|nr:Flp pilus assembly protein CpaB [Acidiphilium angustum]SIR39219.1 pilus assembly protein CpaB [Acidiphilium rubrum]
MVVRISLLIMLALGLAGFGTVAWLDLRPAKPQAVAVQKILLLATAHPLRAGSLIQPADFTTIIRSGGAPPANAVLDTPANRSAYTGAMVRRSLEAGAIIEASEVIRPGDHGFLAAVLQPGMRAISVGVDAITGTAGLIWPGDHVDLILTQNLSAPNLPPAKSVAAETVLSDVRVIAIDQRLVQGANTQGKEAAMARTVTLEVTPDEAERVDVAARLGPLSLIVRPTDSPARPLPTPPPPVYSGQVSPALAAVSAPMSGRSMTIYQGPGQQTQFTPGQTSLPQ